MQDKFFYFLSGDYQNGDSTKQLDPNRIEQRVVDAMAALGSPDENLPITRTDDALAAAGQGGLAPRGPAPPDPAIRLHLVGTGEWHLRRRFLGNERQRDREGLLARRHGLALLDFLRGGHQRVPIPVRPRGPAPAVQRPRCDSDRPPAAGHRFRLRERLPLRHAVLHPGRLPRRSDAVQRQRHVLDGAAHDQGGHRVQPHGRLADLPRFHQRAIHLQFDRWLSRRSGESRAEPERPALHPAGRSRRHHGRRGRHAGDRAERVGRLPPGHLAANPEPDDQPGAALGRAARAGSHHSDPGPLLRPLHRPDLHGPGVPERRHDPVGQEHVAAARRDRLGSDERRQDRRARNLRHLQRPHSRTVLRLLALDRRQPRPGDRPRFRQRSPAPLSVPHPAETRSPPFPFARAFSSSTRTSRTRTRPPGASPPNAK